MTPAVFSKILPRGGRLELLKSRAVYTTCSMRTIKSVLDWRLSLPIIRHVQNLGHPPKYDFNTDVWVILLLVSLSLHFLFLFTKRPIESFHCDVCEFAKHHRITFLPRTNKTSNPFDLVHSNVWGLAPISNISGAKWLFLLLMTALGSPGYFSWKTNLKFFNCL